VGVESVDALVVGAGVVGLARLDGAPVAPLPATAAR
jgi:hypothetical protein